MSGDAYLKYLSSIYLFVTNPTQHEGALHIARQRIISNRSLLKNADRSGLPQYIQSKPFTSKAWLPPNFRVFHPPRPVVSEEVSKDQEVSASIAAPDVTMHNSKDVLLGEDPISSQLNTITNDSTVTADACASNLTSVMNAENGDTMSDVRTGDPLSTADNGDSMANVGNGDSMPTANNGDTISNVNEYMEVRPTDAPDAQISSSSGKKSKRTQEDANMQWLGDKVIYQVYCLEAFSNIPTRELQTLRKP